MLLIYLFCTEGESNINLYVNKATWYICIPNLFSTHLLEAMSKNNNKTTTTYFCTVKVFCSVGCWNKMDYLIVPVISKLYRVPAISWHHSLPFFTRYDWNKDQRVIVHFSSMLFSIFWLKTSYDCFCCIFFKSLLGRKLFPWRVKHSRVSPVFKRGL